MKRLAPAVAVAAVAVAAAATATVVTHPVKTSKAVWTPPVHEPAGDLGAACGTERWQIKTGTDPSAKDVTLVPATATIPSLTSIPAPARLSLSTRYPAETQVYRLSVTLTSYKEEADSDYHLVARDLAGNQMILEAPAPSCIGAGSPFGPGATRVRAALFAKLPPTAVYKTITPPLRVTVTGVAFFDFNHGQRGVAPNGIELHPLLTIGFK